jgi:fumarylacetoacetase
MGTDVIDLSAAADSITSVSPDLVRADRLNQLLAAGSAAWTALREELEELVTAGVLDRWRRPQQEVSFHLAWQVADYVDFYSSRYHAENLGRLFRPDAAPLPENWLHLPVGYHGRSSTVIVDGTPVLRPRGQIRTEAGDVEFGPSRRLDFELELGFVIGGATAIGEPVPVSEADRHLFGVVLLNDWSARDIQAWEYVPLGPFLGKSFATSVSAWVMPLTALAGARVPGPQQSPEPLEYLRCGDPWALDLDLEVWLRPAGSDGGERIATVGAAEGLYWNPAQQLAHMTVNGASLTAGDLFGTGTVSGPGEDQRGSMLELAWGGSRPVRIGDTTRTFLEDGDEVTLRARSPLGNIPLGPVRGEIRSA